MVSWIHEYFMAHYFDLLGRTLATDRRAVFLNWNENCFKLKGQFFKLKLLFFDIKWLYFKLKLLYFKLKWLFFKLQLLSFKFKWLSFKSTLKRCRFRLISLHSSVERCSFPADSAFRIALRSSGLWAGLVSRFD